MAFEHSICPVCGKEFYPASEHALTDTHGNPVCSCHCSNVAYERRYANKKKPLEHTYEQENERKRIQYENKKKRARGEKVEKKPRFMKPVLVVRKEDGAIMGRHPSVKAAAEATGVAPTTISGVCRGDCNIRGKYTFMFEKEEHRPKDGHAEYSRTPALKPVLQFNQWGEFIARFESQLEASKATGCTQSAISQCCNNKQHQTGGFRFMFESEFEEFEKGNKSNENCT